MPRSVDRARRARWCGADIGWSAADILWYERRMSVGGGFRVVVAELAAVGLDPAVICAGAGVDPAVLEEPERRFGRRALARVLAHAEAVRGDPHLGLHMAMQAQGRGLLAYVFRAQPTVGAGLAELARVATTVWDHPDPVRIAHDRRSVTVTFAAADGLPRHALEFLLARFALALGRHGAAPREIRFRHAAGAARAEYERVLGGRVRFACPSTALVLDPAVLERPLPTANPAAAAALGRGLGDLRAAPPATAATVRGPAAAATAARLAQAIESALASGTALDREAVARRLGMSGKTLARRLAAEGSGFRAVVESARRSLAHRLVLGDAMALGEVASRVGFADQAAFGKAFRRWFGSSASALRAAAHAERAPRRPLPRPDQRRATAAGDTAVAAPSGRRWR